MRSARLRDFGSHRQRFYSQLYRLFTVVPCSLQFPASKEFSREFFCDDAVDLESAGVGTRKNVSVAAVSSCIESSDVPRANRDCRNRPDFQPLPPIEGEPRCYCLAPRQAAMALMSASAATRSP